MTILLMNGDNHNEAVCWFQFHSFLLKRKWENKRVIAAYKQYKEYVNRGEQFAVAFDGSISAVEWWRRRDGAPELSAVAQALLQIVPHAANTERIFSLMGQIHTSVRNRLEPGTVEDLVTIKQWHSQR